MDVVESIYGGKFPDENFKSKHDQPGVLSMENAGADSNGSQFFITFKPLAHLDGKHVVFGKVVSGITLLKKLGAVGSDSGKPTCPVKILDSGEVSDISTQTQLRGEKEKKLRRAEDNSDPQIVAQNQNHTLHHHWILAHPVIIDTREEKVLRRKNIRLQRERVEEQKGNPNGAQVTIQKAQRQAVAVMTEKVQSVVPSIHRRKCAVKGNKREECRDRMSSWVMMLHCTWHDKDFFLPSC